MSRFAVVGLKRKSCEGSLLFCLLCPLPLPQLCKFPAALFICLVFYFYFSISFILFFPSFFLFPFFFIPSFLFPNFIFPSFLSFYYSDFILLPALSLASPTIVQICSFQTFDHSLSVWPFADLCHCYGCQ